MPKNDFPLKAVGFTILIQPIKGAEATKGGILKPDSTKDLDRLTAVVAKVIDLGPDTYADKAKFPNGPWCRKGDWILIAMYAGSRFRVAGEPYRLINDDQVRGIVTGDPEIVQPA